MQSSQKLPRPAIGEVIYVHVSSYLDIPTGSRNYPWANEILLLIPGSDADLDQLIQDLQQYKFPNKEFGYMRKLSDDKDQSELIIVSREFSRAIRENQFTCNVKLNEATPPKSWKYLNKRKEELRAINGFFTGTMNVIYSGVSIPSSNQFQFMPGEEAPNNSNSPLCTPQPNILTSSNNSTNVKNNNNNNNNENNNNIQQPKNQRITRKRLRTASQTPPISTLHMLSQSPANPAQNTDEDGAISLLLSLKSKQT